MKFHAVPQALPLLIPWAPLSPGNSSSQVSSTALALACSGQTSPASLLASPGLALSSPTSLAIPAAVQPISPLSGLLDARCVQKVYQNQHPLCRQPHRQPNLQLPAIQHYYQGLAGAAEIAEHSVTEKTQKARRAALREYAAWLSENVPRDLTDCLPEDFLVYFMHWKETRSSRRSRAILAPSSLNSLISHLSRELDQLGREGFWNTSTLCGELLELHHFCANPCLITGANCFLAWSLCLSPYLLARLLPSPALSQCCLFLF